MIVEVSIAAEKDLEEIFDYTLKVHGMTQAIVYVSSFDHSFESIGSFPTLGRKRNEIKKGLRSLVKEAHVVFYRIMEDRIRIVRVIHGARDVPKQFPEIL